MIRQEVNQLKTGARELRKFGLLVGAVFAALGLLFWWRHKGHPLYFLWPGILLMIFGAIAPGAFEIHLYCLDFFWCCARPHRLECSPHSFLHPGDYADRFGGAPFWKGLSGS